MRSSPASVDRADERAPVDPVGIENGLDEPLVDRRAAVEAQIQASRATGLRRSDERLPVRLDGRTQPERAPVTEDDVERRRPPRLRRAYRLHLAPTAVASAAVTSCSCFTPSRTTFSAFVAAASANTSYAVHRLAEREAVRRERRRVEPPARDQLEQLRRRERVDEAGRDQHVADPEPSRGGASRMAVDADVGDAGRPAGSARRRARTSPARRRPRSRRRRRARPSAPCTRATASSVPLLIVTSAPNSSAFASRASARSIGDDRARRVQLRRHDRRRGRSGRRRRSRRCRRARRARSARRPRRPSGGCRRGRAPARPTARPGTL